MSASPQHDRHDLADSQITIPSDSETYDANHDLSESDPPSSTSSPMILYTPPTIWSLFRGAAINLFLPFVNGLMLGFGELFANEIAFNLGWSQTKVSRHTAKLCIHSILINHRSFQLTDRILGESDLELR